LSQSVKGTHITDKDGKSTHPILQDLKSLERVLSYDNEYECYGTFQQCHVDTGNNIIIPDYELRSYDDIISANGKCIWLDVCNIFKAIASKYNVPYKIMDDVIYTGNIIIHQLVDFIILLDIGYILISFNEDCLFYKLYPYTSNRKIHDPITYDEAVGITDEIGIFDMEISVTSTDITDMQFQHMSIKEFNNKILSIIHRK
jgi:hypothetical protein